MVNEEEEKAARVQRPLLQRVLGRFRKAEDEELPVDSVMRKGVIVIDVKKRASDAARMMANNKVGSIVVVDNGKPKGIVTERDIVRKVVAKGKNLKTPLKGVMSAPLRVIEQEENVRRAVLMMKKYNIKRLPVVDKQKRLVGIVTDTDITRAVPGMLDLALELSNVQRFESSEDAVGVCSNCGMYSETLANVGGEMLCDECREEDAELEETA